MDGSTKLSFVEQRTEPIKQLPGFQKGYRVPTTANPSDEKFIAKIAEPILDEDLQDTFSALRKVFGLKRKEISVDGPFEGGGIVSTPFFDYEVRVSIDPESPSRVIFARSISNIVDFGKVLDERFDDVFGKRFSTLMVEVESELDLETIVDTIEEEDPDGVTVDYDKDLTWCEIQVLGSTATIVAQAHSIRVESVRETTPKQLLDLFTDIQQQFIAKLDLSGVSMG